jgi:trimethylamine:corrinoid methyltransferase-like protein
LDFFHAGFDLNLISKIKNMAIQLLSEIGMELFDDEALILLRKKGFRTYANRVFLPESITSEYLNSKIRPAKMDKKPQKNKEMSISCWINNYSHSYIPPEHQTFAPFDTSLLMKNIGLIQYLSDLYGKRLGICGYATDIPPELQDVNRYWLESTFFTDVLPEPMNMRSFPFLYELALLHGCKTLHIPIYIASPLRLGDNGYQIARKFTEKVSRVTVAGMPSFGVTTPFSIPKAFALALAETLGGAVLVNEVTGLEANFSVNLEPFDFKYMTQAFGSPEKMIVEQLTREFNELLFNVKPDQYDIEIHTMAAIPGIQAIAEKSLTMMNGYHQSRIAGVGCNFRGLGTLAMDEVFSPVQLVLDLELTANIERLYKNYSFSEDVEIADIFDGIQNGFLASEGTSFHFRDWYYNSRVFHRYSLNAFEQSEKKDALTLAKEVALQALSHEAVSILDEKKRQESNSIYQHALRSFAEK